MLSPDQSESIQLQSLPATAAIATGVLGEGSCFIHSVVFGMSPQQYSSMNLPERTEYIRILRSNIADRITKDVWLQMENTVVVIQSDLFRILERLKNIGDVDMFMNDISRIDIRDIAELKRRLGAFIRNTASADRIIDRIFSDRYKRFIENVRDVGKYIGDDIFKYIADLLNVFVVFIRGDGTVYPYATTRESLQRARKVVLIKYLEDYRHFENIGILMDGNVVRRSFDVNDPMIAPLLTWVN